MTGTIDQIEALVAKAEAEETTRAPFLVISILTEAAKLLTPELNRERLLALYNRCVEIAIPVEGPSGRNLRAWGDFSGAVLDVLAEGAR